MALTWNETKRRRTLVERGLDFADAEKVFAGNRFTRLDDRRDYGEPRYVTAGYLESSSPGHRVAATSVSSR
jgi:uncharacterized protein